jgi:hypothetical protein
MNMPEGKYGKNRKQELWTDQTSCCKYFWVTLQGRLAMALLLLSMNGYIA